MPEQNVRKNIGTAVVVALQEEFGVLFGESELMPDSSVPDRLGRWYKWKSQGGSEAIVTFVGAMGPARAIEFTTRFLEHFQPEVLVNIGLAGAFSDDVRLGDVVIASTTDLYSDAGAIEEIDGIPRLVPSGRAIETEDFKTEVEHFQYSHFENYSQWQSTCLQNREELLEVAALKIPKELLGKETSVRVGHLACAGEVVKSAKWKHTLLSRDRKYLAVDMESAGIAMSAREARQKGTRILIVRAISDTADERKQVLDRLGTDQSGALRKLALRNALRFLEIFLQTVTMPLKKRASSRQARRRNAAAPVKHRSRSSAKAAAPSQSGVRKRDSFSDTWVGQHIAGIWLAQFSYIDGNLYDEVIEIQEDKDDLFIGTIVPSLENCSRTADVDHLKPLRLRASLMGTPLLTGTWFHPVRKRTHGAFQLRVSFEKDSLTGGWLMFSEGESRFIAGTWTWRPQSSTERQAVGVYGITGAGKTTFCEHLTRTATNWRFFSESDVIDQYMKRFHDRTLDDFKMLTEPKRMEARQAAFEFYRERIKNSSGLVLGDAHYSFPGVRLGEQIAPHPEMRNGIQPVMPEAAWSIYQAIIYIDTPASIVRQRLLKEAAENGRNTWAARLSVSDLETWSNYEKDELARKCELHGKQFFVIAADKSLEAIGAQANKFIQKIRAKAY